MGKFLYSYKYTLLWFAFVLFLSLFPGNNLPEVESISIKHIDKAAHIIMYFMLCFVLLIDNYYFRNKTPPRKQTVAKIVVICITAGGLIEFVQVFADRSNDLYDFIANIAGTFAALPAFFLFKDSNYFNRLLHILYYR